uniref:Uncharacterized protein n=1 Tax=Pfiesteria piscicida TaxID=71001 RepID=A3E3R3_PFIPI|nr:unknown [Pfiesteria piscicida]
MASVVNAKVAVSTYQAALKEKGVEGSVAERRAAVTGVSGAVKSECSPYVEDFFGCFQHRFQLSSCTDATVGKMLKCQEQFSRHLLATN